MYVFDVNWDCVEELYSAESRLESRLLYKMTTRPQANAQGLKPYSEQAITQCNSSIFTITKTFFPGWFISFGWLTMPIIALCAMRKARQLLGSRPDTAVFVSPHYIFLQKALAPAITVYHSIDDYGAYWPSRKTLTCRRENAMIERADLVICAGHYRAEEMRNTHPHKAAAIHHIPNPVPANFICKPEEAVTHNKRPVIGFIGSIEERVDTAAIVALAKAIPEADIVLRSDKSDANPFGNSPNVRYLERMDRKDLPALIRSFDICIVPQSDTYFNKCSSPRKLYEYLGSSKPIVTMNTPEAAPLAPYVRNADNTSQFIDMIKNILVKGELAGYPEQRLLLAQQRTPAILANKLADLIMDVRRRKNQHE